MRLTIRNRFASKCSQGLTKSETLPVERSRNGIFPLTKPRNPPRPAPRPIAMALVSSSMTILKETKREILPEVSTYFLFWKMKMFLAQTIDEPMKLMTVVESVSGFK